MTYFTRLELTCRCGCGLMSYQGGFLDKLHDLRQEFGKPMVPTSACRCARHNATVSKLAPRNSLHIGDFSTRPGHSGCMAIDIATPDGTYRGELFRLAWARQWSIGWNAKQGFLHLDRRVDLGMPQTTFDY